MKSSTIGGGLPLTGGKLGVPPPGNEFCGGVEGPPKGDLFCRCRGAAANFGCGKDRPNRVALFGAKPGIAATEGPAGAYCFTGRSAGLCVKISSSGSLADGMV